MYPLVYKYLMLNKKVSVPGIGNFFIITEPAFIAGSELTAPTPHIQFRQETALADKAFYQFLAAEMSIEDVDAIKHFHEFAYELRGKASYADGLQFPGIGTLRKQPSGSFSFEEEHDGFDYYKPVHIQKAEAPVQEKIIATEIPTIEPDYSNIELEPLESAEPAKKDLWWVYAIVLAAIGIGAIVYYYM